MTTMDEGWKNAPDGEQTVTKAGRWEAEFCKELITQNMDPTRDTVSGRNYWVPSAIVTPDHRLTEDAFSLFITKREEWHGSFKSHADAHKFYAEWKENDNDED